MGNIRLHLFSLLLPSIFLVIASCASAPEAASGGSLLELLYSGANESIYLINPSIAEGSGTCYLIKSGAEFMLIDSGIYSIRKELVEALSEAGCVPGSLKLLVLTHGHYDHTGNAAFLQSAYLAKVLLHTADAEMVQGGLVPTATRKYRPWYIQMLAPLFLAFYDTTIKDQESHLEKFIPDILIDEGNFDLRQYGFAATVLPLPGHSEGSIGILAAGKNLFAGDLLVNFRNAPTFNSNMADESFEDLDRSWELVKTMDIETVFPGHGRPFPMKVLSGTKPP